MGSSFLLSKYVAVAYGPGGMVHLGNFLNLNAMLMNLSTGAIENGVVRHVAEAQSTNPDRVRTVLAASAQIVFALSVIVASLTLLNAGALSRIMLNAGLSPRVVIALAVAMLTLGPLNWATAAINGFGMLSAVAVVTTANAAGTALVVALAITKPQLPLSWFLFLLTVSHLPALATAAWFMRKATGVRPSDYLRTQRWHDYRAFFHYSLMSGASALIVPAAAVAIRNILVSHAGLSVAGVYEGLGRMSTAYLAVFSTTLSLYYLPTLSASVDDTARARQVRTMFRTAVPLVACLGVIVFLLRDVILSLLFSPQFVVDSGPVALQLIGDLLRIASWVLAYQMIARGMVVTFVVWETIGAVVRIALAAVLIPRFGLDGAVGSYALTYVVYGLGMLWLFGGQLRARQ